MEALTGEEWWLPTLATLYLEQGTPQLRSLPAGQYRATEPPTGASIERFTRLSFVIPWRDVNVRCVRGTLFSLTYFVIQD